MYKCPSCLSVVEGNLGTKVYGWYCLFLIEFLHICNITGSEQKERQRKTKIKDFCRNTLSPLADASFDKQKREKKEGSAMPPGHGAELAHSILFPGLLDKIYGNNIQ